MGISFRGEGHLIGNERGQSLVEYILLLVVSVALILGLIFEFSSAFKAWANNYFGDYLTCLLETGELPSIGGTPGDSGTCNQFFQPFSLKNGRPSNALSKGNTEQQKSSAKPSGLNRAGARREGTVARAQSRGGGSWNGSGNGGSSSKLADTSEGGGGGGDAKTGNTGVSSGEGYSSRMAKSGLGDGGRQIDGRVHVTVKKDEETKKGYVPTAARNDNFSRSPKRVKVKEARKPAEVAADEPMTFGNFIRLLIMAALIIALVVVIGGQVLQATKGMDAAD